MCLRSLGGLFVAQYPDAERGGMRAGCQKQCSAEQSSVFVPDYEAIVLRLLQHALPFCSRQL